MRYTGFREAFDDGFGLILRNDFVLVALEHGQRLAFFHGRLTPIATS
jgi:hypothetical protein